MKNLICWCCYLGLAFTSLFAAAGSEDAVIAAVTAADEARMAAMKSADPAALDAILSDELRYAHSNGKVDTKAVLVDTLVSKRTVYESFEYRERTFVPVGPGAALMRGRVIVGLNNPDGRQRIDINFLAVWREENGKWRFLAWQSSRNPPVAPVPVPEPPLPRAPAGR